MKLFLLKYSVSLVYILGVTVVFLVVAAVFLFMEKKRVLSNNHSLILQNDSIMSEHIHLKQQFLQRQFDPPGNGIEMSTQHRAPK